MIKQAILFYPSADLNVAMGLNYSKFRVKTVDFQNTVKNVSKPHAYTLIYSSIAFEFEIPVGVYTEQAYLDVFAELCQSTSPTSLPFANVYWDPDTRRAHFGIVKNSAATVSIKPKTTPGPTQESTAVVRAMVGWGDTFEISLTGPASTDAIQVDLPQPMNMRAQKNEYFFLCSNELSQGGAYINNRLGNCIACIPAGNVPSMQWIHYENTGSFLSIGRDKRADHIDAYLTDTAGVRLDDVNFCVALEFE